MKDETFPQWLLLAEYSQAAAEKIYLSIVAASLGTRTLIAVPQAYDPIGSTRDVAFDTRRPVIATDPNKCHLNYVVADTDSWEQRLALALEDMEEVQAYVKNQNLGFSVPFTFNGLEHAYNPDFIARVRTPKGSILNLIIEVTGQRRDEKDSKVATMRDLWIPAVNNLGLCGEWAFLEVGDPYNAKQLIRSFLTGGNKSAQRKIVHGN